MNLLRAVKRLKRPKESCQQYVSAICPSSGNNYSGPCGGVEDLRWVRVRQCGTSRFSKASKLVCKECRSDTFGDWKYVGSSHRERTGGAGRTEKKSGNTA